MKIAITMLCALLATIIIEYVPTRRMGVRARHIILVNALTNLSLNTIMVGLSAVGFFHNQYRYACTVLVLELVVVAVEAWLYAFFLDKGIKDIVWKVFLINLLSFAIGVILSIWI